MHRRVSVIAALLGILFLSLGCNGFQPAGTSVEPGIVETHVAATFTALASIPTQPNPTATLTSEPTSTDTSTPEPSPTLSTPTAIPRVLQVVYIKDGKVFFWKKEQVPLQLTTSGQAYEVKLSSDGVVAAFTRRVDDLHSELWAVNTDGSDERRLVSVADLDAMGAELQVKDLKAIAPYHFAWIPGTHTLAYNTREVFDGPGLLLTDDLRLVNTNTLEKYTFLPPGKGGEFSYSPDGSQIAISTTTTISLIDADGSNRRSDLLVYDKVLTYSEYEYYAKPVWASDSSALRVAIPPKDALAQPPLPTILWEIPTDGSPAVQLGSVTGMPFFSAPVKFSPDLSHIAYLKLVDDPADNRHELHIADPDGSGDIVYDVATLLQFQAWAPDSSHFVFSIEDRGAFQLGEIGGNFTPLMDNPTDLQNLRWINQDSYLVLRNNNGVIEIRLNTLSGDSALIDTMGGTLPSYDFAK
jgi:hypothetical protein